MKKKILVLLLTLAAAFALFAVSASAAETASGNVTDTVTWSLTGDGVLTIRGTGAIPDYSTLNQRPWHSVRSSVTSLIVEPGVTAVGDYDFQTFTNLKSVTLADSVTVIGSYAFSGCSKLTDVNLGAGLETIGGYAFSACPKLENIDLPDSVYEIGSYSFENCTGLKSVTIPDGVTYIDGYTFSGCSSLTSVEIPDSVTGIGWSAFSGCSSLKSVTIPNSVTSIEGYAFYGCSSLKSVEIPDSVTSIEGCAFEYCSSLTSVNIPDSVTYIGYNAFSGCSSLTSVNIPDSVTYIGDYAFSGCSSLTSVTIPDSVTSIGGEAFSNCSSLTSVTIPDSVTGIGWSAFSGCSSLKSVTIPDSVTSIDSYAFSGCSSLMSVTIPEGVSKIDSGTFDNCSALKGVVLPERVSSIGSWAFYGCGQLTDVYYGGTKTQWDAVSIDDNNEPLYTAAIHYASCAPAVIVTDPADFPGTTGDTAVFTVEATGGGLTYRWQYSDDNGKSWKTSASTGASATCKITEERGGRLYRCIVTDGNGDSVTSAAAKIVFVAAPASILCQPSDSAGSAGAVAAFAVVAEGEGLTYAWEYSDDGGQTWKVSSSTGSVATCKITAARHGRIYRCTVADQYGNSVTSGSAMLYCRDLSILSNPKAATISASKSATFTVKTTGIGLSYQWQYKKPGGSWTNCSAATNGYNTDTLRVQGVTGKVNRSNYQYRCIVTDATGVQLTSDAATLTVTSLNITAQPQNAAVAADDYATFTVKAAGEGMTYQWQFKTPTGDWKNCSAATQGYDTDTLTVQGATGKINRNNYQYRCVIRDASGDEVTTVAATLTVK